MSTTDRVEFSCPHCHKTLQVKPGRKIAGPCPACGQDLAAVREMEIEKNVSQYIKAANLEKPESTAKSVSAPEMTTWQIMTDIGLLILGGCLLLLFLGSLISYPSTNRFLDRFHDDNAHGATANAIETIMKFVKWFCPAFFELVGAIGCFALRELRKIAIRCR